MTVDLTTHVLNTAKGIPAKDMKIELWRFTEEKPVFLTQMKTDCDGRVPPQQLKVAGIYELLFYVGDYFKESGETSNLMFLDQVPIRFGIELRKANYHIPLLISPWSYQTYRGS
ncbi:hydroxyisourate hydrolase [Metabacillus litoralis]|uniref:hydroxyisourate hydrolase n=1 Tax=Metabacillus litoralis TaxID=152268 RepID=UPI001CFC72DD|nr:hydroxyisourate hydrolase [Metabacillus litoralis]